MNDYLMRKWKYKGVEAMKQRYIILYMPKRLKIDGTNSLEYARAILKRLNRNAYFSEFVIFDTQLKEYVKGGGVKI